MSLISVIIPAHNGEKFLPHSIGSVLAQTYRDFELIVVDDGSTDDTEKVVEKFQKKDPRVSYYYEKNSGGPAKPKNLAMQYVKGDYIAYLDQDDEWMPRKLEKQIALFEQNKDKNIGLVSCGALLVDGARRPFGVYMPPKNRKVFPEILLRNPIYSNSSVMVRREVVENIGGRDETMNYSEDWDMWIRIAKAGYGFAFVREPLFKYYFHNTNTTVLLGGVKKVKDTEYVFGKHYDLYKKFNFVHVGFFLLGVRFFLAGDTRKSRENFIYSIHRKRSFVPPYIGYALSFMGFVGVYFVHFLIFLYRILHGKTYFIKQKEY